MEEVDENVGEARPSMAQRVMRRVPGSFNNEVISPIKEEFDDMAKADLGKSHPLRKENIPTIHPPSRPIESSFADYTGIGDDDHHVDSMTDEQHVRAHLSDIESSFVQPVSPVPVTGLESKIDGSYLFDSTKQSKQEDQNPTSPALDPSPSAAPEASDSRPDEVHNNTAQEDQPNHTDTPKPNDGVRSLLPISTTPLSEPRPTPPPNDAQQTSRSQSRSPLPELKHDDSADRPDAEASNTTSELETLSSSPSAAAAARTVSRAISMASNPEHAVGGTGDTTNASSSHDSSRLHVPDINEYSTLNPHNPGLDLKTLDAGHTPGQALKAGKRPKYLRSRNGSQRSSSSSFTNEDIESDVTGGLSTDFAIQPGGAISAYGMQRSLSNMLSRSISIGSVASGLDNLGDPSGRNLDPLEPLEEVERSPSTKGNRQDDFLATPKANKGPLIGMAPTDTVIARHVRNVEVPEAVAIDFKNKGGLSTPTSAYRKISDYTPVPGTAAKNGRNLTLKEQSSTIDRLSKENFDLKLKVMFLSDRLEKISEEGVKEMISENVELKTSLAVIQRDNKMLRRRVKELEKRLRDRDEERPSTAKSGYSSDGQTERGFNQDAHEREEELLYLRERVEEFVTEIEELKSENMAKEAEKRKLAEVVKTMGDRAGDRVGDSLGRQEEADVFKDLLEQETARREQADEDNRRLRDEVFRLKQEVNAAAAGAVITPQTPGAMHHTTNIYNITRKAKPSSPSRSRPVSGLSGEIDQGGSISQATTLVDELRRESDQLRHENAELRREVGAQTSMLTSRNREKERLYQEIEDLKLAARRGGGGAPSTVDSLLDRSASRAGGGHERSHSRASGRTRLTMAVEDPGREELEEKLAEHRDKINELKLQNQELQRELETCMEDFETAVDAKRQAEQTAMGLQEDLDNAVNDLMILQTERDEALEEHSHLENEFDVLRKEAQEEIDALEGEADQRNAEILRLETDLQDRTENFDALQEEMRKMSEALIRLEDDQENKHRRIEELEHELRESNKESEELEAKLLEANEKANRLGVQQESGQGEIAFLREEQEGDKIRIGDLEAAVANCEQCLRDERERVKELEQRIAEERRQREIIATREKEEIQQFVNDLNREMTTAKDEARRLRKSLTSREVEATEWKERLLELENNLREALGDLNGTRSSLLKGIARLQRELENTVRELETTKASLLEKDRVIKQRDALLESHGLESRKLAEMLEKERQAHRTTKNAFETFQRTHQHVSRTVTSQDGRILELETQRATDKKRVAQLESSARDQLTERNNLLLVLWTRLSGLCGSDWAHGNSLIDGRALPSLEAVSTMLPGFSKNLLSAVKTLEQILSHSKDKIRQVEKDLWKEYQTLENSLDTRSKKLERLEALVRNGVTSGTLDFNTASRISQLEAKCRSLKMENATLMRANDAKTRAVSGYFDQPGERDRASAGEDTGSPSPSIPTGPIRKSGIPRSNTTHFETTTSSASSKSRTSTMKSASANINGLGISNSDPDNPPSTTHKHTMSMKGQKEEGEKDNRWMFRLRELEYKLKQEREERNLDRAAARQRIREEEKQREELARELVRVKRRGGSE